MFGGDLNARCGSKVNDLLKDDDSFLSYKIIDHTVNNNGKELVQICSDNDLLLVNGLETNEGCFQGELTFRRRKKWISDVDKIVMSSGIWKSIELFSINQDTSLPSDHAPLFITLNLPGYTRSPDKLLDHAHHIDGHAILSSISKPISKKVIPIKSIDSQLFSQSIVKAEDRLLPLFQYGDPNVAAQAISDTIYDCMKDSVIDNVNLTRKSDPNLPRWKKIMEIDDEKVLWNAIDWNGDIDLSSTDNDKRPSDDEFQKHLESLLVHTEETTLETDSSYNFSIPLLDDPIQMKEVDDVIQQLKPKGVGPDGVHPSVIKWLPKSWLPILLYLMNLVFLCSYPLCWTVAKLNMLFKKGIKSDCDNYRGISIINCCYMTIS